MSDMMTNVILDFIKFHFHVQVRLWYYGPEISRALGTCEKVR